jgi:hypothetical protein
VNVHTVQTLQKVLNNASHCFGIKDLDTFISVFGSKECCPWYMPPEYTMSFMPRSSAPTGIVT